MNHQKWKGTTEGDKTDYPLWGKIPWSLILDLGGNLCCVWNNSCGPGDNYAYRLAKAGAVVQERNLPCSMRILQQILRNKISFWESVVIFSDTIKMKGWIHGQNKWPNSFSRNAPSKNNDIINGLCRKHESNCPVSIRTYYTQHKRLTKTSVKMSASYLWLLSLWSSPLVT